MVIQDLINEEGTKLPWFTYPAIEYLRQLDMSDKKVFEWGCGSSSLFFANRCCSIISIEHNISWYEKIIKGKPDNLTVLHIDNTLDDYYLCINKHDKFDIIVVDSENRKKCCEQAINKLKSGGIIIFDNSNWFVDACNYLRGTGLIQVDFHGNGQSNAYAWTTSVFFTRDFDFLPKDNTQPMKPIGGTLFNESQ